jgi:hypothetical protein
MIQETLNTRCSTYGSFDINAELTQSLMAYIPMTLSNVHLEAIHMIFHKISRMVNGDQWHLDNAHDIAGYATLLEDYIRLHNNETTVKNQGEYNA